MTLTGTSSAALGLSVNTTDRTGQTLTVVSYSVCLTVLLPSFLVVLWLPTQDTVLAGPEIALGKDEATACGNLTSHSF